MQILALITFRFAWHRFAVQVQFTCTFYNVHSAQKSEVHFCAECTVNAALQYKMYSGSRWNYFVCPPFLLRCAWCLSSGYCISWKMPKLANFNLSSLRLYTPVVNLGGSTLNQCFLCVALIWTLDPNPPTV